LKEGTIMNDIDILEQNVLDIIMPELLTRAGRIYIENSEYKAAVEKADSIFEEISDRLMYQQGMKDLLNMLITLLKGENHDTT